MKLNEIYIGLEVRHPDFDGIGIVKAIAETTTEVLFNAGKATLNEAMRETLIPADPHFSATVTLNICMEKIADLAAQKAVTTANLIEEIELANKWVDGKIKLTPKNPELQPKEIEINTFLHKIIMIRDNLRVLEQKINTHPKLDDISRIELQQYITRAYGSLTTFNVLFKNKEEQF